MFADTLFAHTRHLETLKHVSPTDILCAVVQDAILSMLFSVGRHLDNKSCKTKPLILLHARVPTSE
jgi:hypothetical protein